MTLSDPLALRRRQAQMFRYYASSYKIDFYTQVLDILNLKGYQNCIIGAKVTAILLIGLICPLVQLHREWSAPTACAAGLFKLPCRNIVGYFWADNQGCLS